MPLKELERLKAVNRFLKLEISKEKELQDIVSFAASICGVPTALITIIAEDLQHIKFKVGFDKPVTSRGEAFCNHTIEQLEIMVVPNALLDERFVQNPLVVKGPKVRFYAGAPLTTSDGFNLGSLCVIDKVPRELNEQQQKMLTMLAKQVIQLLEFDASLEILKGQFITAKQAEIELRSFFESSIDCHLLLGRNFEILAYNKASERLIKNSRGLQLARGNHMAPYLHADIEQDFYAKYLRALQGTAMFEQRKLDYHDHQIDWVIKYEPAFNQAGEIIGVSVNSTDVSSRVKQEEKVAAQHDSLSEIAFIQSHEIRRPLASVMGLIDVLKAEPYLSANEAFQLMEQSVLELDGKIRQIVNHTSSTSPAVSPE